MSTHSTIVGPLTDLTNQLVGLDVTQVVMDAARHHWKPLFYVLDFQGLDPWLINARVKHLPRRSETDRLDAAWSCQVAEGTCCDSASCRPGRSANYGPDQVASRPWSSRGAETG